MPNIRRAHQSDSKDIFDWRNDALTRQMSHTTDLVQWDEHNTWFAASLKNQNRLLLICEDENLNKKIAVVRFDIKNDRALISINLSPSMRGKGKAKSCLIDAIKHFKTIHKKVKIIDAEVISANIASQRSFSSVGFILTKKDNNVFFYEYTF